jgi:hypothetical protein
MATLLHFPPNRPPARPPEAPATTVASSVPATGGRRGEYALADVARPLGLLHRPVRSIVETLRVLARHEGMPLPRSPRIVKGKPLSGPRAICRASRWDAGEFDAWLDGRGPAAPSVPLAPPVRLDMANRAAAIGAGR